MEFRAEAIRYLLEVEHERRDIPLCACHPIDILSRAAEICRYRNAPPQLTKDLIGQACKDYFTEL